MLLNQPDPTTITTTTTTTTTTSTTNTTSTTAMENKPSHLDQDQHLYHNHNQTSALFAAAQNGHTGKCQPSQPVLIVKCQLSGKIKGAADSGHDDALL